MYPTSHFNLTRPVDLSWLEKILSSILVIDVRGKILYANREAEKSLGYRNDELLGRNASELLDGRLNSQGDGDSYLLHARHASGVRFPIRCTLKNLGKGTHGVSGCLLSFLEEDALPGQLESQAADFCLYPDGSRQEWNRLKTILDAMADPAYICTEDHRISFANKAFTALFGNHEDRHCYELFFGSDRPCLDCPAERVHRGENVRQERYIPKLKSTFELQHSPVTRNSGAVEKLAVFRDISLQKKKNERLWKMANFDPLTELPNRRLFGDRLNQAILQAGRDKTGFSLLFLDLDGFKEINDRFGHAAGDQVLRTTAWRLVSCLRKSDSIGRQGGDEFVVLLHHNERPEEIRAVIDKMLACLREPIPYEGLQLQLTASVGVSRFPEDGSQGSELMEKADQAMYRIKHGTKGRHNFYTDSGEISA